LEKVKCLYCVNPSMDVGFHEMMDGCSMDESMRNSAATLRSVFITFMSRESVIRVLSVSFFSFIQCM
jgi:hypothetical protein